MKRNSHVITYPGHYMQAILVALAILLNSLPSLAQHSNIDSLKAVLKTLPPDTARVKVLNKIAYAYHHDDPDQADGYGKDALKLAETLDYRKGIAIAQTNLGLIHQHRKSFSEALEHYQRSLKIFEEIGDESNIRYTLEKIGYVYFRQGDNTEAVEYYRKCLKISEERGDKHSVAEYFITIGAIYYDQGYHREATKQYNESMKISEELGDKPGIALCLINLGSLCFEQHADAEAMDFFQKSLKLYEELGDERSAAACYRRIGLIYTNQGVYPKALEHIRKSMKILEEYGEKGEVAKCFSNIASIYLHQGAYNQALEYLQKRLKISEELGDEAGIAFTKGHIGRVLQEMERYSEALSSFKNQLEFSEKWGNLSGIAFACIDVGVCLYNLGDLDSALVYLHRSLELAEELGHVSAAGKSMYYLQQVYADNGDYEKAYTFQLRQTALKDSLLNEKSQKQMNELLATHEAEQREKEIALLEKDKQVQALELDRRKDALERHRLESLQRAQEVDLLEQEKDYQELTAKQAQTSLKAIEAEAEKKSKEVELLSKEKKLQEAELSEAEVLRNSMLGGVLLLLIIAGVIYRQYRYKKRTSEQLQTSYDTLKRTQQQLIHAEKMATLGELTAGVAHEIKNPLNFITNFSVMNEEVAREIERHAAENGGLSEAVSTLMKNTNKIREHGKRADSIVNSMLLHSRETRGARLDTDINHLVIEGVDLAQHGAISGTRVEVSLNLDKNTGIAYVLPAEISRVVMNLVGNAMYSARKMASTTGTEPHVEVSTQRSNGGVSIIVKDNGVGISDAIKEKIFQPFFSTKPTGEGTGLGLSLCWDIVIKGHNGTIEVESEEGMGASFTVKLPVKA